MKDRLQKQLDFLIEADKLKTVLRQTVLIDKSRRENDAEHSWHFALAAVVLHEYAAKENVDLARVMKIALIHDMVEIYAGDTFAYDEPGYADKQEREARAADRLFSILPDDQSGEFRALWEEFERMETADAQFAAACDRLQPFINNSMTQGHTWAHNHVTSDKVYKRMDAVRTAMPELWEFVENVIRDSIEKGYLLP